MGSLTWPKWPESADWTSEAHQSFEREALLQNSVDGVNREQGIWYHHEVTDMMIIAALVAKANGIEFSQAYWKRIESMLEFSASVMDRRGNVPAFGDSDDAVIVRFCPESGSRSSGPSLRPGPCSSTATTSRRKLGSSTTSRVGCSVTKPRLDLRVNLPGIFAPCHGGHFRKADTTSWVRSSNRHGR